MNNSKQPNDYTKINFTNSTLTIENNYKKFTMPSTPIVARIIPCEITGDFEALFEVKTPYYFNVGVYCQNDPASKSSYCSLNDNILDDNSWYYIKVKRVNKQLTVQYSSDNNNWINLSFVLNNATDETCKFNISSGYSSTDKEKLVYFKNMRVYPI